MINDRGAGEFSREACLADEDLYLYISGQGDPDRVNSVEAHLAGCSICRRNLAGLLEILQSDSKQALTEPQKPSKAELDRTIGLISAISRRERGDEKRFLQWFKWPAAAAAAFFFVAIGFWMSRYVYERNKSEVYFSQAQSILEQNYTGVSPGKLRLALPFGTASIKRSDVSSESLRSAEILFSQAMAIRYDMIEAHLGLAYIYLNETKADQAKDEFQEVLDLKSEHIPALVGRGVAQYEEAIEGGDPTQRDALLAGALDDFNSVLKLDPKSPEARYNKVWILVESGLHKEALEEIERYLSLDAGSVWAEQLRSLKIRIRATQIGAVEDDVRRFARQRDEARLGELAHEVPYQMPAAILSAVKQSLEISQIPVASGEPSSEDLRWAAQVMEAIYSNSTGDHSFKALLTFYDGLSPSQRALKIALDKKYQTLERLYDDDRFTDVLRESASLANEYAKLGDFWQLPDLYHLRGNSFYMGRADFDAAEAEYRKMLESADSVGATNFSAKAIGSLAMIHGMQRKFDDSLREIYRMKQLAKEHNLESWQIDACLILGHQFRRTGQFEKSLHEYTEALSMSYRLMKGIEIIESYEKLGLVMNSLGRVQEAAAFYRRALQQLNSFLKNDVLPPSPEVTNRRLNLVFRLGELALHTDDLASAEAIFSESLNFTSSGKRELESRILLGLAETYLRMNRFRKAEKMIDSAISIGISGHYPEIEWQAETLKGKLLERAGNEHEAFLSFQKAIEIIEGMHRNIRLEELRQSFLMDRYAPFRLMVSLLYQSDEDTKKTLQFVERAKSVTLKQHLKKQSPVHVLPKDVTAGNPEDAYSIIEYFFTRDALLIFLTSPRCTEVVSQSVRTEELSRQIDNYVQSIQENDPKAFSSLARLLYEELIFPIEDNVFTNSSKTLVILPDGPLHMLPFAGLQDQEGRFLIEKAPLAYAPSRSVFQHCVNLNRAEEPRPHSITLIDGSANLPSARNEINYLSRLYGRNARTLTAKDIPVFQQAVAGSQIVHFSGHSTSAQDRPVLVLQTSSDKSYLDCQTINSWKMSQAYLVNLAGCRTGIGPVSKGEAPWGLIPAFLNAGAPSIIASLMPVDDRATSQLNCLFYDLLQSGQGKAEALQKAQLALLNSARSEPNPNPQAWTPYILVGNPQ